MPEIKLKPCPFCGGTDIKIFAPVNDIGRAVLCNKCNMRVGFVTAIDDSHAADMWNRRADNAHNP